MTRRVAITGMGVVAPGASDTAALWDLLVEGRSALGPDPELAALGMRCRVSGRIPDIEARTEASVEAREARYLSRFSRLGLLAATEALDAADARRETLTGPGGVVVGTAAGPMSELEASFRRAFAGLPVRPAGHAICRHMASYLPSLLAGRLGARLGGHVVSLACTSALAGLATACAAIERGDADWYVVGAVEEDSPYMWLAFDAQRLLAAESESEGVTPAEMSRPFDARAFGFVPSGGAAFLVLEAEELARRRGVAPGVRVLAACHELGGSLDFAPMRLDADACTRVARDALSRAGTDAASIDLVTPHAPSSPLDGPELEALDQALDLRSGGARVNTPRSLLGYAVAASGLMDVVHLALQLEHGLALPNRHIQALSEAATPYSESLLAPLSRRPLRRALKSAYGFGRSHAAVVLEAP